MEAADDEPVYLVMLVLAAAGDPGPNVALLAEIARLLRTPGLRQRLMSAATAEEVLTLLREAPELIGA